MYDAFKDFFLYLFCAPAEPPAPPAGTHSSLRIFRASRRFLDYQLVFLILALMVVAAAFLAGTGLVFTRSATLAGLTAFWLICFWILLLMAGWFLIRLEYDMRYYIVTDRSLRIRRVCGRSSSKPSALSTSKISPWNKGLWNGSSASPGL